MLKIPYGISDYKTLIEKGYFYQDRTSYIETLEAYGPTYFIYLRPRRFGKSLWLSTMKYYYGEQYKDSFEQLFHKTAIGQRPTQEVNSYKVLQFDFSGINTQDENSTAEGFLAKVKYGLKDFFTDYPTALTEEQKKEIISQTSPNLAISTFFNAYRNNQNDKHIYILIDEYDHFANELIAFNYHSFSKIVSQNGFVRKFYETIKTATGQGIVGRMFITGVAPITLDSLTSGFNIATSITLSKVFHQLTGFEESEVASMLSGISMPSENIPATLEDMRLWYNGFLFNPNVTKKVFNPNMVLYFAQQYKDNGDYPEEMLDANIASDYTKIRKLFKMQGDEQSYISVLETLTEVGEIESPLVTQFSLDRTINEADLVSLLFYMGFLTIKTESLGRYTFTFPNYVIKKLYGDYFLEILKVKADYQFDNSKVNAAIIDMAKTGNPQPFFDHVTNIVKRLSTRDAAHFNENTLKAIIISLLHQQSFYFIHSEYESDWTFMDIFLETIHGHKPTFEVAFELKYIHKAGSKRLSTIFNEGTEQLKGYLATPKFSNRTITIKAFVVILVGDKLHWKIV
jgi:hypothetical protein